MSPGEERPLPFRCEFTTQCRCTEYIQIGYSQPDNDGHDVPTIMHPLPLCWEFETLETLAYLRWLRNGRAYT